MESSSSWFSYLMFNILIMLLSLSLVYPQKAFSHRCHHQERSALLQFKQSFVIDTNRGPYGCDDSSYPKVSSWNVEGDHNSSKDCCMWDGIDCDEDTGHVIGIDLSCSHLCGSINSNSSLFHLVHLQRLNLAWNDFNRSHIPTGLVHLSKLTYLNLSYSSFSGQVTREISHLSMLSSLDLSGNDLTMNGSNFKSLIQNLTSIKQLILKSVEMELTVVPEILANLSSSLTTLNLADCRLRGEFPGRLFNLPNLHYLNLLWNENLTGYLPEFHSSNTLNHLKLIGTGFSGKLPDSLGNLSQLNELDLSRNNFGGHIPSSFYQLKNLEILDLSDNQLSGTVDLDMFVLLKNLSSLSLSDNNLSVISSSTYSNTNTTIGAQLEVLELDSCKLTKFPEFLRNQTKLSELSLVNNSIQGLIPVWIFNNTSLKSLYLGHNSLTGFDQSPVFNPDPKLEILCIDNNRLKGSLPIPPPSILIYVASNNALEGEIPPSICNLTSLNMLDLSNNALEGELPPSICNLTSLNMLYLSNNAWEGELPPSICNLTSLGMLDLSDNGFSGKLPPCLVNLSSLYNLKLQGNYFGGTIPDIWTDECGLLEMVLSENQFEGELPRSLANCTGLEILDVGDNQIKDSFPFWLGTLPGLKILVVKFNRFYGAVRDPDHHPTKTPMFPMLHIIDLSHNFFSGHLPLGYFQQWNSMIFSETREWNSMPGSVTITYKGIAREYYYIQNLLNLIDLSSNKFEGEIPELIGNLNGLHSLNLSYNFLTGRIPSSLANLSQIEALELSHNKLSGQIPQQLTQLNFLEIFSVAHNTLTGPIPHGKQFDTFLESSFEGNAGLCGKPLSEECGNSKDSPPSSPTVEEEEEEEEKGSPLAFGWKPVAIGYGCGSVIGIVVGHFVINRRYEWVFYTFGIRLPK